MKIKSDSNNYKEVMIGNKPYFIEHKVLPNTDIMITIYPAKIINKDNSDNIFSKGYELVPDTEYWEDNYTIILKEQD